MNQLSRNFPAAFGLIVAGILLTASIAHAATVSVQSLSPSASVAAGTQVTFTAVTTGLNANLTFSLSDSFSGGTITTNTINGVGGFYWTPTANDVGTHVLTVTASDNTGSSATAQQTITVTGTPSTTIQAISPSFYPAVGANVTFKLVPSNFPNTSYSYSVTDTHPDGTLKNSNIDSNGNVTWKPTSNEQGVHTMTFTVSAGGTSASLSQRFNVGGTNPNPTTSASTTTTSTGRSLSIGYLRPSVAVGVGTNVTIGITPSGYTPTSYTVLDAFTPDTPGNTSTVLYGNVNATGSFAWTPASKDIGTHVLTFTGTDGAGGTATVTTTVVVLSTVGVVTTPTVTPPVSVPVTTTTATTGYYFANALQAGSTGSDVLALQAILVRGGYLSATPTGTYGPLTTEAVKAYQIAHGLSPLGIVGPGTRAALNAEAPTGTATLPSVSVPIATGMSAATKQVLLQIAAQLQQLASQLTSLAQ